MNIKHPISHLIILCFCLLAFTAQAAEILLKVDRTQIEFNETFKLSFQAEETPDDDPDFSPLEKDFDILNSSTSSNVVIINGKYSRSKTWTVSLTAKHTGAIVIPAISFGKDTSQSYQIVIKEPQQSTAQPGDSKEPIISELKTSTDSAYPQQQIIITRRLLSSHNLSAYEFAPLTIKGVEFVEEDLGEVKQYQTKYGDTSYIVLEKNTAIYPQTSGELMIEPSVAGARITIRDSQHNGSVYDPFHTSTRTVRRSSAKKTITVKPIPDTFKGSHWLAAKEVQLVEEFPDGDTFKVGEPITRTLLLIADGQNSSQLPEIEITPIKGLKQYPDQPLLKNNASGTGVTGVQQIKVAIIPSAAGTYTLPTISIPWWNTTTDTLEFAKIYPRTFSVAADAEAIKNTTDTIQNTQGASDLVKQLEAATKNLTPTIDHVDNSLPWKISTLLLTLSLLITLQILWKRKDFNPNIKKATPQKTSSIKAALKNIKQACINNDAHMTKDALLQWGQALFINQEVHSLGDLASRVDGPLSESIQSLNAGLYRNNSKDWRCDNLLDLCAKYTEKTKSESKTQTNSDHLEGLYK